jgi:pSer/pThr/pTyr-binding forkhead associated (FHA) protein
VNCAVCRKRPATIGVLCEDCRDDVSSPLGLLPDQILATVVKRADAALIDQWGRPHPLENRNMIGRTIEGIGLQILQASISRHHAHLALGGDGVWTIRDLGSANGTFLNELPVTEATALVHGDRIGIGQVDFYFATHALTLPEVHTDPTVITTIQKMVRIPLSALTDLADTTIEQPVPDLPLENEFEEREDTDVGLATIQIKLAEPSGGGGGLVKVDHRELQLTPIQFELFALLARRMASEVDANAQVRGFVRSSELLGALSWDTRDPSENHLKQLVRRVRRAMIRAGIGDLLESRHRFGYRLRVIPELR